MNGQEFTDSLLKAMPTAGARLAALSVIARWAGTTIYIPTDSKAERRARVARNMLDNGMSGADVTRVLRERFQISERTAQRSVNRARQMSKPNGGDAASN